MTRPNLLYVLLTISICVIIYLIAFNDPKPIFNPSISRELKESNERYKTLAMHDSLIVIENDSLKLLILNAPKTRIIYRIQRNEAHKNIEELTSDSSIINYLADRFANRR